ncbi:MAG TPA: GTP 3',8-cyclase MoaA [Candidatus Dormibacteraeota bacterium]|jgi:cyclic pyranopterin phosphate synthase|nr:GTP 3',8-cyclase MoaA [Candidatus Dormibacteraeota bacterium]
MPTDGVAQVEDRLGRRLRDLRISVTDRCNFRCPYCMPAEVFGKDYAFLPRDEILTFEEIVRIVRVAAAQGVTKVRLTGGEPLVRREVERLVAMVAAVDGVDDIAMTTNGATLAGKAKALKEAGLTRITVSLDSLDDQVFQAMNGVGAPLARVLDGIDAASAAGLAPIKLNAVVQRGVNDGGILDLARFGRERGFVVRFIEYMDVGTTNGWRLDDVVPAAEIVETIGAEYPLQPLGAQYPGEVARRYRYADGEGEVGVIASVTQPFCQGCTRARLTAEGKLYTCLFATAGHDLRAILRASGDDAGLEALLSRVWRDRVDRYSEERASLMAPRERIEMSYVGG